MAKKKAAKTGKKLATQPKTLLKQWHEKTAGMADTEGLKINAADTSRVIDASFSALATMCYVGACTETEVFQMLLAKFSCAVAELKSEMLQK